MHRINYADMLRIGKIRIGKLDWEGRDFTYGQRIELGEIFGEKDRSEYSKLCDAFKCLYGCDRRILPMKLRIRVFDGILKGLKGWIDREQKMLSYTPSGEELSAGIRELSAKVGSMSTIKSMAKTYSVDPDRILEWPYGKVFGILYTDLEERKYEKKLQKVYYDNRRTKHR